MPSKHSFDVVSSLDLQEVDNAVNQAIKEVRTRFDFRNTKSSLELRKKEKEVLIIADDDLKLRNIQDILKTRAAGRGLSVKSFQFDPPEEAFEGTLRQRVGLVSGIEQDKAKNIVKLLKEEKLRVEAAIQGDSIRVTAKSKDELQAAITLLKNADLDIPLQFTNFR